MHFSIKTPTGIAVEEVEDATIGASLETTGQSGNIALQSDGANTIDAGDSSERGDGANGKQTDSDDDATGLSDAEINATAQSGADGTGDTASKPSDKKGWFSKGW